MPGHESYYGGVRAGGRGGRLRLYDERFERAVWRALTVVEAALALRFATLSVGLPSWPPAVRALDLLTGPLLAPFRWGPLADWRVGALVFEPAALVAMVLYGMLGWLCALAVGLRSPRALG